MFIVNIVFSVLFPTTDMGTDVYLAHHTVNYIGANNVLRGCRHCFHKSEKDIFGKQENGCTTCFSFVPTHSWDNDNETQYTYQFSTF